MLRLSVSAWLKMSWRSCPSSSAPLLSVSVGDDIREGTDAGGWPAARRSVRLRSDRMTSEKLCVRACVSVCCMEAGVCVAAVAPYLGWRLYKRQHKTQEQVREEVDVLFLFLSDRKHMEKRCIHSQRRRDCTLPFQKKYEPCFSTSTNDEKSSIKTHEQAVKPFKSRARKCRLWSAPVIPPQYFTDVTDHQLHPLMRRTIHRTSERQMRDQLGLGRD